MNKFRAVWYVAAAFLLAATALAPLATDPAPAEAAPALCQRDTASDLRWISWAHLNAAGFEPTLVESARWLTPLGEGATYLEVAASIGSTDGALAHRVAGLYRQLLERTPGQSEAAGWVATARSQGSTTVAVELAASAEAYSRGGDTDRGWINRLYQVMLGRSADQGGSQYWTGRLASGVDRRSIAAAIWATPASIRRRTERAYQVVLGRAGDQGGLDYWSATTTMFGDEGVEAALTATSTAWGRAQQHYGAPAAGLPPLCPRVLRWMPAAGTIVRTLQPVGHLGTNLATLTFDDGPDPTWTPQILDVLARYRIRATFFMVGSAAQRYPDLVRRIVAEGHHVAIHTMTHPNLLTLGRAGQYQQIAGSKNVVESIAGAGSVSCFRPPYGNRNATTDSIAAELGLATIMWSRDGRDWARPGADSIVSGNLDTRYDGGRAILLLHDGGIDRSQTVAALPRLIDALTVRGYRFVQIC